jgi:hypothetical protein
MMGRTRSQNELKSATARVNIAGGTLAEVLKS